MSTALAPVAPHKSRRCFRWDMTLDAPVKQAAETKIWLSSDTPGGSAPPDPATWSAGFARAIIEALLGARPLRQLQRWMVPSLYAAVSRLSFNAARSSRSGPSCAPTTWRTCEVLPGVVESSVIIRGPERSYAVALRLEAFRGRWIATALEVV